MLKTERQWQRQNKLQHGKGLELSPVYLLILTPWGRKWMGSLTWWCHPVRNMTYMHTNACARAMLSHITNRWMECHVTYLKQCRDVSGDDNTEPDWKTLTAWFHERSSGTKHLESQHECLSSSVKKEKEKFGKWKLSFVPSSWLAASTLTTLHLRIWSAWQITLKVLRSQPRLITFNYLLHPIFNFRFLLNFLTSEY